MCCTDTHLCSVCVTMYWSLGRRLRVRDMRWSRKVKTPLSPTHFFVLRRPWLERKGIKIPETHNQHSGTPKYRKRKHTGKCTRRAGQTCQVWKSQAWVWGLGRWRWWSVLPIFGNHWIEKIYPFLSWLLKWWAMKYTVQESRADLWMWLGSEFWGFLHSPDAPPWFLGPSTNRLQNVLTSSHDPELLASFWAFLTEKPTFHYQDL